MSDRPEIIDRYLHLYKTTRAPLKELEGLKAEVRKILELTSYPDIYVTKPAKTKELDPKEAMELAKDYLRAGLLTQEKFEGLFIKVINPDAVWKLIRSGDFQTKHLWLPKNGKAEVEETDGIRPRRVVYYTQATPSIRVPNIEVEE